MASYTLVLTIDPKIFRFQSGDHFNIAKKVNDEYTRTFDSGSFRPSGSEKQMFVYTEFQWTEEYAAFLSSEYDEGRRVSVATDFRKISFGKSCEFRDENLNKQPDADDSLFDGSSKSDSFVLKSVHRNLQASVAIRSGHQWVPIYVDKSQHDGNQNKQLPPVNN